MELAEKILKGDERSAARLITMIEEGDEAGYAALSALYPHVGKAHVVGITGSPGTGKSTLINRITLTLTNKGRKVGIIAIDPTSMRGRGALLGDRLRMKDADKLAGIFIRSMAHRGHPGGVSKAAPAAVYVVEALGKDVVIVESVGAGQTDMGIRSFSDTIVSVLTPDYGDEVQLLKAGIMEIGDIVVVNKKDKQGAEGMACDAVISMESINARNSSGWRIPVLLAQAVTGEGVDEIVSALHDHYAYLEEDGRREARRKEGRRTIALALLKEELWKIFSERAKREDKFLETLEEIEKGRIDPYRAVGKILAEHERR